MRIEPDNDEVYEFKPMVSFHSHSMFFLKNDREYAFVSSCSLELNKYSFRCFDISQYDVNILNKMMVKLHPNVPIVKDQIWLNPKHCTFFNAIGGLIFPTQLGGRKWMIRIRLMGYKIDSKGIYGPVWALIVGQDARSRKSECGDETCLH